jgi:fatty acid/phospholipid synthesis protein PlsX
LNILVDAMGSDHGPNAVVEGCFRAIKEAEGFDIKLIGDSVSIKKIMQEKGFSSDRLSVIHADEVITMEDSFKAVRTKKNSSMSIGLNMLKEKQGDVFLSAGNTGALLTGATVILHRIKGVDRPALAAVMPSRKGCVCLIDCGANTICKPINLLQFGIMGSIYMQEVFDIKNPKVGIINNGTEEHKGTDLVKESRVLLEQSNINFMGNIEGRDVADGEVDVVVCDGFVGNILLKFYEGAGSFIKNSLKEIFTSSIVAKVSTVFLYNNLKKFTKQLDYTEHGGAPLLGVNGKVMKTHGSSNAKTVKNAVLKAAKFGESTVLEQISNEFNNMEVESSEQED